MYLVLDRSGIYSDAALMSVSQPFRTQLKERSWRRRTQALPGTQEKILDVVDAEGLDEKKSASCDDYSSFNHLTEKSYTM
jgi:hypothetical protein